MFFYYKFSFKFETLIKVHLLLFEHVKKVKILRINKWSQNDKVRKKNTIFTNNTRTINAGEKCVMVICIIIIHASMFYD